MLNTDKTPNEPSESTMMNEIGISPFCVTGDKEIPVSKTPLLTPYFISLNFLILLFFEASGIPLIKLVNFLFFDDYCIMEFLQIDRFLF